MFEGEFYEYIQKDIDSFLDSFLDRDGNNYTTEKADFRHDWYAYQDEYAYNL